VARANRLTRARAELGADRVVSIQYSHAHDPLAAVAHADPHGTWAMAAATWLPDGGDSVTGTVLGVDADRLPAVGAAVSGGPSLTDLAGTVGRAHLPTVTVRGTQVQVRLTASNLSAGPQPQVQINLRTKRAANLSVPAGSLRAGTHVYTAAVPCTGGCTFTGLTWYRPFGAVDHQHGTVLVRSVAAGTPGSLAPLSLHLAQPQAWRPAQPLGTATDSVSATATGTRDEFSSHDGGYGGIAYAYLPVPMPAVATARAVTTGSGAPKVPQMIDSTQTVASFQIERSADVLPAVLSNGLVLNLRFLTAELPGFAGTANWQVWLGPRAPHDAIAQLRAAGLIVQGVKSISQRTAVLGREGPALALLLLLACAVAGTVLAVGGTAISVSASSRRRSYELAALQAVKVPRSTLLRAGIIEQLLLLGTAVVLGVPSGLLAAVLALPAIPEFSDATAVRLHYGAPPLPVALFVVTFVVLLVGTAVVASRSLIQVAVPTRLREEAL
jgi:putative ABC transport system permease protein